MNWTKTNLPNTRAKLEQFVKDQGLHPYGIIKYKDRDIFIAETDLEKDDFSRPFGYWQVAWFVTAPNSDEKMDGGSWGIYDAFHDMDQGWTAEEKRQARIRDIVAQAEAWINKSEDVGRYDAEVY